MNKHRLLIFLLFTTISVISILYWKSILDIPFHPDEATQIFMSRDVDLIAGGKGKELLFSQTPLSLTAQHYHLVDPPVTRYLIGISRLIFHNSTLTNDWNWSLNWEENNTNGALPSQKQLFIARSIIFLFFPCSLFLIYRIGATLGGILNGWICLFLFATNSLIILHTQRAMTDGPLIFWILLSIYLLLTQPKNFWLISVIIALAINTKLTALALIPILIFQIIRAGPSAKKRVSNLLISMGLILGLSFILNPVFWNSTITALSNAIRERSNLMSSQSYGLATLNPEKILASPVEKVAGMIGNIFFQPPAISDMDNYDQDLSTSTKNYLSNPIHTLSQQRYFSIPFLVLSISGFSLTCIRLRKKRYRDQYLLIILCFIFQTATILLATDLPFQRYALPVIPYCIIFTAIFITSLVEIKKPGQE